MPSTPPPASGERGEGMAPPPFSGDVPIERAEKVSTRRPRTSRPPIRVDEVGDVAVAIATKASHTSAPRLLKSRRELSDVPIDHRDGFVLSLIDGKMNIQAIIDISGMPGSEIVAILERLRRLGIISLP